MLEKNKMHTVYHVLIVSNYALRFQINFKKKTSLICFYVGYDIFIDAFGFQLDIYINCFHAHMLLSVMKIITLFNTVVIPQTGTLTFIPKGCWPVPSVAISSYFLY
jgi:hypothetical protein